MKKVLVVGGSKSYYRPFAQFGDYSSDIDLLSGTYEKVRKNISLVLFTGGEDVFPGLYGEPTNVRTSYSRHRDEFEVFAFTLAKAYDLPMVGVCRGAQFLCVMAGGRLVQHVENHSGNHPVTIWDGRSVVMSSTHHQMQIPPESAEIIGWMEKAASKVHLDGFGNEIKIEKEVEVAYYPNIKAVGMQYHPEMMNTDSEGFQVASEFVSKFLFENEVQAVA